MFHVYRMAILSEFQPPVTMPQTREAAVHNRSGLELQSAIPPAIVILTISADSPRVGLQIYRQAKTRGQLTCLTVQFSIERCT